MEESLLFESASDSWIIELWTYTQHFSEAVLSEPVLLEPGPAVLNC